MRLILTRGWSFGAGGIVTSWDVNGTRFWGLSREWKDNRRNVSCIPPAFGSGESVLYRLERHNGTKYRDTWAIVGEGVSHVEEPGVARFACVLHPVEFACWLEGCEAMGFQLGWARGVPVLKSPQGAFRHFRSLLSYDEPHELLIEDRPGGVVP